MSVLGALKAQREVRNSPEINAQIDAAIEVEEARLAAEAAAEAKALAAEVKEAKSAKKAEGT